MKRGLCEVTGEKKLTYVKPKGDSLSIDYRPTEKGLETPQIYPGIDVTTRN